MKTPQSNNVAKTVNAIFVLMTVMFSLVVPASALSQFCVCPDCDIIETAANTKEQPKPACCAKHAEKPGTDRKAIKERKPPACDCCSETDVPPSLLASSRVLPSKDSLTAVQTRFMGSTLLVVASARSETSRAALSMPRSPTQRHHQLYCVFRI